MFNLITFILLIIIGPGRSRSSQINMRCTRETLSVWLNLCSCSSCSLSLSNSHVGYQMLMERMVHEGTINSSKGMIMVLITGTALRDIVCIHHSGLSDVDHVFVQFASVCRLKLCLHLTSFRPFNVSPFNGPFFASIVSIVFMKNGQKNGQNGPILPVF